MGRRMGPGGRSRVGRAHTAGRRVWPVVMMAWERWQSLSEEDRERYRRRARDYAERGRRAVDDARKRSMRR
jgi:hypothetical protein